MPGYNNTFNRPLSMQRLPKPEYALMNKLIEHFQLDSSPMIGCSELFTVLLRLAYEVMAMRGATITNGEQYITEVINTWRSHPMEVREYPL
jgi:hypothetical protein